MTIANKQSILRKGAFFKATSELPESAAPLASFLTTCLIQNPVSARKAASSHHSTSGWHKNAIRNNGVAPSDNPGVCRHL